MRIEDILDAIDRIQDYTRGMTFEALRQDRKAIDAVVRAARDRSRELGR